MRGRVVCAAVVLAACQTVLDFEPAQETGGQDAATLYASMVLAEAPIAYWRLGDAVNPAKDEVGKHPGAYAAGVEREQPGALVGSPDFSTRFNGGRVEVPHDPELNLAGTSFTLEFWIKPEVPETDGLYRGVFVKRDVSSTGRGYSVEFAAKYEGLLFNMWSVDGRLQVRKKIDLDVFSHAAIVFDVMTSSARLYVNGELAHSASMKGPVEGTDVFLAIGGTSPKGGLAAFKGVLDEVAVYPKELGASTIRRHYEVGIGR